MAFPKGKGAGAARKQDKQQPKGPGKKAKPPAGPTSDLGGMSGGPPPDLLAALGAPSAGGIGAGGPGQMPMAGPLPMQKKKGRAP